LDEYKIYRDEARKLRRNSTIKEINVNGWEMLRTDVQPLPMSALKAKAETILALSDKDSDEGDGHHVICSGIARVRYTLKSTIPTDRLDEALPTRLKGSRRKRDGLSDADIGKIAVYPLISSYLARSTALSRNCTSIIYGNTNMLFSSA